MNFHVLLAMFALGGSSAPLFAVDAPGYDAGVQPMLLSNQFVVAGEVVTRGEMAFTIVDLGAQLTTVYVNPDTAILKGAESIRLADVFVGDKVSVVAMRAADGHLQAVRVDVKTGYE